MRDASQHILFVATEYAAGMRPYANTIVHVLWQPGDHVLVVAKDDSVKHDFDDLPADSVTWIDYPTSKLKKLAFRFWPSQLFTRIKELVADGGIQLIYSLTGELVLMGGCQQLQRMAPLLYTIHDAVGHDSKFDGLASLLKHKLLVAWPQSRLIRMTRYQITNSKPQQQLVKNRFPYHNVYYAPFPTLVTDAIEQGNTKVPELADVPDGYILFFGNLQLYKGVHLLYDAFLTHPELQDRRLVIAGSGYVYFKCEAEQGNVTFINRFIDDSELRDLFTRAAVVVYPYISATQSGVASIASYFDKPMVLSDLPFFKQTCEDSEGIEFFTTGDREALAAAITRSLQSPETSTRPLYDREYTPQALHSALTQTISQILASKF